MTGTTLGRYEILSKIGQGGMGEVYLAHDTVLRRRVALKVLHAAHDTALARDRFLTEARAAAAIDHPYICKVYEAGDFEGQLYIAMEFIDGPPLRQRLKDAPLDWHEVRSIAVETTEAIGKAHKAGIIHRDLKPSNIMLTQDGHVKVVDFGLAKRFLHQPQNSDETVTVRETTGEGVLVGTLIYMSPEQVRQSSLDARSDLFSLGIILYELLTGVHPFRRGSTLESVAAILNDQPPPLGTYNPNCPLAFAELVARLLWKDSAGRVQSAAELLGGLRGLESASGAVRTQPLAPAARPVDRAVAVLPLVNMSSDPEQEFFSDGITEDIIAQLSKVPGLKVIARTSIMRYKGSTKEVGEIGAELGVATVLEGSVRRSGNRVRISAGLVDVETRQHVWTERYDRELTDVFAIQLEVAEQISHALSLTLGSAARRWDKKPRNFEAYQYYLRGRYFLNKMTPDGIQKAVSYFNQAMAIDPADGLNYSGLSTCYALAGNFDYMSPHEAFPKAKAAAQKALEIDPRLAEAHTSMGLVKFMYDWEWDQADEFFRTAINLSPGSVDARTSYCWYLVILQRYAEAMQQARTAHEIDPLAPMVSMNVGWVLLNSGACDDALEQLQKTLEIDPHFLPVQTTMAWAYWGKGMYDKAIELLSNWSWRKTFLAMSYAMAGRREEALRLVDEMVSGAGGQLRPSEIGLVYLYLGDREHAERWFERAIEERDYMMAFHLNPPWAASTRHDPLVARFLGLMGLKA